MYGIIFRCKIWCNNLLCVWIIGVVELVNRFFLFKSLDEKIWYFVVVSVKCVSLGGC